MNAASLAPANSLRTRLIALTLVTGVLLPSLVNAQATPYPRAGWQATLTTNAHGVRGTVTIVDADTFRIDNFYYDGGGINVHFIVAPQDTRTSFVSNRIVTDRNFLGTAFSGGSATVDLPTGTTLDGHNAVSLWCIPASANFGSGTFRSPLEVWRQATFGTVTNSGNAANAADSDRDGVPNLLEYATRTDPISASGSPLKAPSNVILPGSVPARQLTFNIRSNANDIHYVIQRSLDLRTWTEVYRNNRSTGAISRAAGVTSVEDHSAQTIAVTDSAAATSAFWRLVIEPAT